jgi:NitT/TauT family transport system ATP-binding protein
MTRTLVLDDVAKAFPTGTVALEGVSLTVAAGEFVSVVGPSGCGKSTLLRLASGLDEVTGGDIEVNATSTSYVFQEPTLLEWRSALRNVELAGELRGAAKADRRKRAQEALDLVGLTGFEKQHPRQLSGGMRMRVSPNPTSRCSTSRSGPSTRSPGCGCRPSCRACSRSRASPGCSSRTPSRRRSTSPPGWS